MNDYELFAAVLMEMNKGEGRGLQAEILMLMAWREAPEDSPAKQMARQFVCGRETIKAGEQSWNPT